MLCCFSQNEILFSHSVAVTTAKSAFINTNLTYTLATRYTCRQTNDAYVIVNITERL